MYEDNFILNAARLNLSEENIANLKEYAQKDMDWGLMEKKACQHGVDTFIYFSLKKHNLTHLIPADTFKRFQGNFYRNAIRNSAFIEEINNLSEIIEDKIVLLKGVDLIQHFYPNIAIRSMCDIDILVEKNTVKKNWYLLQKNGFIQANIRSSHEYKSSLHQELSESQQLTNESCHHLPALLDKNGICIELHWYLFHIKNLQPATSSAWLSIKPIRKNISTLSNEMKLILACEHFYSHLRECIILRALCDIHEILEAYRSSLDWTFIQKQCTKNELTHAMTVALTLCSKLFKIPVPGYFFNEQLFCGYTISLDFLLQGFKLYESKQTSIDICKRHFLDITQFPKLSKGVLYLYKTFVPDQQWITHKYNVPVNHKIWTVYIKYWSYLFGKHFLRRKVQLGN